MGLLLGTIEHLDLFKRPVLLYIGGKKHISKVFGIFLSLAIYCFLAYNFIVSDMFKRKNPFVYDQSVVTEHRPSILKNISIPFFVKK
jgi:hypothetical protein